MPARRSRHTSAAKRAAEKKKKKKEVLRKKKKRKGGVDPPRRFPITRGPPRVPRGRRGKKREKSDGR